MKLIRIGPSHDAMVDDNDFEWLSEYAWYLSEKGYVRSGRTKDRRKSFRMHRLIMNAASGELVDHIDCNPLNNQRSNLRLCSPAQNAWNRQAGKNGVATHLKGIWFDRPRNRWQSSIKISGEQIYLGAFSTPEEAHAAYCAKAKELFGEFANDGTGPIR